MAVTSLTVSGINPNLAILGDTQKFIFTPSDGFLSVQSLFAPTTTVSSYLSWDFTNSFLGGYRWTHITSAEGGPGTFKLSYFVNGSTTGVDILTISAAGMSFHTPVSLNNQRIISLGSPIVETDAANMSYVQSQANISGTSGQIAVTGTNPKILSLAATGVIAGTYTNPTVGTDATGRITSIVNGTASSDSYQTLSFAASLSWSWSSGNIAVVTLTGNTTITPVAGTISKATLIVKQDATGSRQLSLPVGIFKTGGTSANIPLSTAANAIDILEFKRDGSGNIYLWNVTTAFVQIPQTPTAAYVQVNNPFGSATSVTQATIQAWYDSYGWSNTSPNTPDPSSLYPSLTTSGGYNLWLGSTTWYYVLNGWQGMSLAYNSKSDFGANIASIARGW